MAGNSLDEPGKDVVLEDIVNEDVKIREIPGVFSGVRNFALKSYDVLKSAAYIAWLPVDLNERYLHWSFKKAEECDNSQVMAVIYENTAYALTVAHASGWLYVLYKLSTLL